MAHVSHKDNSRLEWGIDSSKAASLEQLQFGAIQRIADATELMARSYKNIIADREFYERKWNEEKACTKRMNNQIRGLKSAITKLKRKA